MADNITIVAYLKDLISRPARQAEGSMRSLERQIEDLKEEFDAGRISLERYEEGLERIRGEQRRLEGVTRKASRTQTVFGRKVGKHEKTLGKTKRRGLRGALGGAVDVLGKFSKSMLGAAKSLIPHSRILKLGAAFSVLIPVITAVGGGLLAAAGSAAPMIGLLAALPGLGLAAAAGLGVVIAAVSSLSEGIALLADPNATVAEINEFWADKTPEAKAFGVAIAGIIPMFTRIRDAIHQSLLPELGEALEVIAARYAPFFEQKLADIGDALGRVATRAKEVFTGKGFMDDMTEVWDSTARIVEWLGNAGVAALSGLRSIMVSAIPMTENVARGIGSALDRFDRWAASPVGRNKMSGFFTDAWETAKTFFGALKDFSVGLWNIMMIGKDLGDAMGGGIAQAARDFRDWTESVAGQERIRQFFIDIKQTLVDLGELFGAIGREFLALGADAGAQGDSQSFLDGLTAAVPGIFEVIGALIKVAAIIGKVIVGVVRFFEWLGKIPGVGQILQWVVGLALFLGRMKAVWLILRVVGMVLGFVFGGWVMILITAIVGGLILLYQKSETFRSIIAAIPTVFSEAWGQLKERFIDPIIEGVKTLVDWIGRIDWPSPPDWMTATPSEVGDAFVDRAKDAPNRWWERGKSVFRKDGGPVLAGQTVTVGEGGREFLLSDSGVTLVGKTGRETRRMGEDGMVLPNALTERILAGVGGRGAPEAAVPTVSALGARAGGRGSSEDVPLSTMPPVQIGPFYGADPREVQEAVRAGIRQSREDAERRHGRKP